jgi:hypothetical protein
MVLRNIVQCTVEDVQVPHLAQRGVREHHRYLQSKTEAIESPPVMGCYLPQGVPQAAVAPSMDRLTGCGPPSIDSHSFSLFTVVIDMVLPQNAGSRLKSSCTKGH